MKKNGRYIDPTTDYGFKRIFEGDASKELLIDFLNELFKGRKTIKNLTYGNTERVGDSNALRTVIFDLFCTADDGEMFIVEMQSSSHANIKERMLYYGSKLIADQAEKDAKNLWNYNISEVYVIVIMDGFRMPGGKSNPNFIHRVRLCDEDTGEVFYKGFGFIYLELVNFTKTEKELETDLEKWTYVIKNMSNMQVLSKYLRKPIFEKLFSMAEYSNLDKKEREMYNVSLKRKWDHEAVMSFAKQEGFDQGIEEGLKKAEKKIALNLKKSGLPIDMIAKNTGLSVEEINRL